MTLSDMALVSSYDYQLVALSVLIAVLASYSALDLAGRVTATRGSARLAWLIGGAIAMGTGIWSMHYIGMLAFQLPIPVFYDWPTVLLSLLAAVFASAVALFVVSRNEMGLFRVVVGSIAMGGGIATMHYTGMAAMRLAAMMRWSSGIVTVSVILAMGIALVALLLAFHFREERGTIGWQKFGSAVVMGLAIPVMHYTGMAAVVFTPSSVAPDLAHAVSISALGITGITIVTIMVLGLSLVTSLVDRRMSSQALQLEASEQRYRQLVESAQAVLWERDIATGKFRFVSKEAESLLGHPLDRWASQPTFWLDCIHPEDRTLVESCCRQAVEKDTPQSFEHRMTAADGKVVWLRTSVRTVAMEQGKKQLLGVMVDISENIQSREEARRLRKEAEAASQAKSEFLANMSHEIRTPMNAIVGMTDLALDTELTREQTEYLTTVKSATDSLLNVINDILDFSKIEAGKLEMDRIPFSLREAVEETMKMLAVRADEKGLELACRIAPETPNELVGDPDRLRQVLTNLVGNGIKFTAQGEVIVDVVSESKTERETSLHFSVRDTGVGIRADKLEIIFEAFAQADTSTTRQFGGTGLGLAIASRLVELMGGRLWAESKIGRGSTFHFTARFELRQETTPQTPGKERESVNLIDLPVLVVDDNATNSRILEEILTKWGMRPFCVDSGLLALDTLYKAQASGKPYALILLDVHMPGMDGFEVAQRVKQNSNLSGATVMMLTSATRPGDIARCKKLGVAAYLIKPIRRTELLEAMLTALGSRAAEPSPLRTSTHRSINERRRGVRILLVEDNAVNQTVALRLLTKHGHRVVVAGNGREALLALERAPADGFDLVLMDVQMPEMDGFEATAAIREREKATRSRVPIVAMTAHVMKGDRERCLAAGMDDYISKPIQAKALLDLVERLTGSPAASDSANEPSAPHPEGPDWKAMLEVFEGDVELVREIVDLFLQEFPRQCAILRESMEQEHWDTVERVAHSLKGSVSNFAFPAAFHSLQKLEQTAREKDQGGAIAAFAAVEETLRTLQTALAGFLKEQPA